MASTLKSLQGVEEVPEPEEEPITIEETDLRPDKIAPTRRFLYGILGLLTGILGSTFVMLGGFNTYDYTVVVRVYKNGPVINPRKIQSLNSPQTKIIMKPYRELSSRNGDASE